MVSLTTIIVSNFGRATKHIMKEKEKDAQYQSGSVFPIIHVGQPLRPWLSSVDSPVNRSTDTQTQLCL